LLAGEIIELTLDASQDGISLRDDPSSREFTAYVGDRFSLDIGYRDLREDGRGLFVAYVDTIISDASVIRPVLYDIQRIEITDIDTIDPGVLTIYAPGHDPAYASLADGPDAIRDAIEQDLGYGAGNVSVNYVFESPSRLAIEIIFSGEQYEFVDVPDLQFLTLGINSAGEIKTQSIPPYINGDKTQINTDSFYRNANYHGAYDFSRSGTFSQTAHESIDFFGSTGFDTIDQSEETGIAELLSAEFVVLSTASDITFQLDDAYEDTTESFLAYGIDGPIPLDLIVIDDDAFLQGTFLNGPDAAKQFTVNTTADTSDANLGDGLAEDEFGLTSLRAAIEEANATPNVDVTFDRIDFAIPGVGPHTIELASALPAITEAVIIDATTQNGYDGVPVIQLNAQGRVQNGLELAGDEVSVRGLSITGFQSGIYVSGGKNHFIGDNFLGITPEAAAVPNHHGLRIDGASFSTVTGNVISGNHGSGVFMIGVDLGPSYNKLIGNFIGTSPSGEHAIANAGAGVAVYGGTHNELIGNVISGNGGSGVVVSGEGTTLTRLRDNLIGTSQQGDRAIGNGAAGVAVYSPFTRIGDVNGGNVISGNKGSGILLQAGSIESEIGFNKIGTDVAGTFAIGNGAHGVNVIDGHSNHVGVTFAGEIVPNIISGNKLHGVNLATEKTDSNSISRNLIGTDVAGSSAIGNGSYGIHIAGGDSTWIRGNVIAGNGRSGLVLKADAENNAIIENRIGISRDTSIGLPNGGAGVMLAGQSSLNEISGNTIAGNRGPGLLLSGHDTVENTITDNMIGSDGPTRITPNGPYAIAIQSSDNDFINNTVAGSRIGIDVSGTGAFFNSFVGNFVGTDSLQAANFGMQIGARFRNGSSDNYVESLFANNEIGIQLREDAGQQETTNSTFQNNAVADIQDLRLSSMFSTSDLAMDVSGDGLVTPVDALEVLNVLANQNVNGESARRDSAHADVNRDGDVTPADALEVLNWLGESHALHIQTQERTSQSLSPSLIDSVFAEEVEEDLAMESLLF
jgi:CSLREA domain-containing protein